MGRVDALLCQSHGHAPDLLGRPADQSTGRRALVFVFGGGSWFAWWRTAAIMANASITSETCRCHPCQDRVSLWASPSSVLAVSNASSIAQRRPSTLTSVSIGVPAGHQVEKNASWPSAMLRRIRSPRVHRPVSPSAYSPASRSASSQYAQSYSRSPFVLSPAERRGQALSSSPAAIASAVPATGGLSPHELKRSVAFAPST